MDANTACEQGSSALEPPRRAHNGASCADEVSERPHGALLQHEPGALVQLMLYIALRDAEAPRT